MQTLNVERRFLSVGDLARETGEAISTWRKRICRREIAALKFGRNVRVDSGAFSDWVAQRTIPARSHESE
jgi:hypothetical protein